MTLAEAFRSHDDHYSVRLLEFRRAGRLPRQNAFGQERCVRRTSSRRLSDVLHLTGPLLSFAVSEHMEEKSTNETSIYQNLSMGTQIGVGSFGKVYRMTSKIDPRLHFAVKIISKHHRSLPDDVILSRLRDEVQTLVSQLLTCRTCERSRRRVTVLRASVCRWTSSRPCSHVRRQCG